MRLPTATQVDGRRSGGTYRLASVPWRWVTHTDEVPGADIVDLARRHEFPPHFWADPRRKILVQIIDTARSAYALAHPRGTVETNHAHAIQVEINGRADQAHTWPVEWLDWLADTLIAPVARHHGINLDHVRQGHRSGEGIVLASERSPIRMSATQWLAYDGICGHQHVPVNDHWDPGGLDIAHIARRAAGRTGEWDEMATPDEIRAVVREEIRRDGAETRARIGVPDGGDSLAARVDDARRWIKGLPTLIRGLPDIIRASTGGDGASADQIADELAERLED